MHKNVRFIAVASVAAVWGIMAFACSSDDENPAVPRPDSGSGADVGAAATGTGTGPVATPATCDSYGGTTGVAAIAADVLSSVQADCRLSGAFANLSADDTKHLSECFTIQMQSFFGCSGVTYGQDTKDSKGQQCRNMRDAHQNMNLRNADFQAFSDDTIAVLGMHNVSSGDAAKINNALVGTKVGVVQENTQSDKNTYCACPNGEYNDASCVVYYDASTDASDSGTTKTDSGTDSGSPTDAATDGG